jgi:hypothetical protein
MPPLVTRSVRHRVVAQGNAPNFFCFGQFLLILADFVIFSGFLN